MSSTLVVTTDGIILSSGCNKYGQLGLGDNKDRDNLVPVDSNIVFSWVSSRRNHTAALDIEGNIYRCGYNGHDYLPLDNDDRPKNTLTRVNTNIQFSTIACGTMYIIALDRQGNMHVCGDNEFGQLALGDTADRNTLTRVNTNIRFSSIACGYIHTVALDDQGNMYTCGRNDNGQLALGDTIDRDTLTRVDTNVQFSSIACGAMHTVVLDHQGSMYTCGNNDYQQLGIFTSISLARALLRIVDIPTTITQIACSDQNTLFLDEHGDLYCCGINANIVFEDAADIKYSHILPYDPKYSIATIMNNGPRKSPKIKSALSTLW